MKLVIRNVPETVEKIKVKFEPGNVAGEIKVKKRQGEMTISSGNLKPGEYRLLAEGMGGTDSNNVVSKASFGITLPLPASPNSSAPAEIPNLEGFKIAIRVNNPRKLSSWELPADRIAIGEGYKPSMALLPNGELVMISYYLDQLPQGKIRAWTGLWRSTDNGLHWSNRVEVKDMLGDEPYLTSTKDGTLFITSGLIVKDINNKDDHMHYYIHRSTDGGRTWQRTRIGPEGFPAGVETLCSRNIVELPDGTLLLGVSSVDLSKGVLEAGRQAWLWTSRDHGKSWDKSNPPVKIGPYQKHPYNNADGFFAENFIFQAKSGKLFNFIRCGPPSPMYPMNDGRTTPKGGDATDRTLLCESTDGGKTWNNLQDLGDYSMMYPRIIRLQDGRLLMTFTQRGIFYPIGLQAIFSYDDGETWDFQSDHIIIEGKTPWGRYTGSGFGNTLQLKDGNLISCSSYRQEDNKTYIDVVRWQLPVPSKGP